MSKYEEARRTLDTATTERGAMVGVGYAVLALVEELREARKPLEVRVDSSAVSVPDPRRDFNFLPGDVVRMSIKSAHYHQYDGNSGVVTYGPNDDGGYLISAIGGEVRCHAKELTMLTRREDRTQ